jgi:hypothetical protein
MRMYETTTRSRRQTAHGFVRHHMPVRVDLSGMGCDAGLVKTGLEMTW